MTDLEVPLDELPNAIKGLRSSDSLVVRGGGILVGADLANIAAGDTHLLMDDSIGALLRSLRPAKWVTKVGRDIAVFEDCDFSGLRGWFEPGIARFHGCRFLDVNVRGQLMQAHFVGCQFSGTWEASFTTEAAREDPRRAWSSPGTTFERFEGWTSLGCPRARTNSTLPAITSC